MKKTQSGQSSILPSRTQSPLGVGLYLPKFLRGSPQPQVLRTGTYLKTEPGQACYTPFEVWGQWGLGKLTVFHLGEGGRLVLPGGNQVKMRSPGALMQRDQCHYTKGNWTERHTQGGSRVT